MLKNINHVTLFVYFPKLIMMNIFERFQERQNRLIIIVVLEVFGPAIKLMWHDRMKAIDFDRFFVQYLDI